MKRKFTKHPVCASNRTSNEVTLEDVLAVMRDDSEFLLETQDAVYLTDPSAATFPGVMKLSHKNISKAISHAVREYGDPTAEEVVSDFMYEYATFPRVKQLVDAYHSAGQEVPDELFNDDVEAVTATDVDNSSQKLLDLAGDMLYQTYDNSPEYSLDEAYDSVLDHVIMVITQMDDDGEYAEYLDIANYENTEFTSIIRQYVEEHYDDYRWYAE